MAALTDQLPTAVAKVPHPVFVLSYEQKNITSDITPYVRSVTYTDYLSGQSDELEVELEDADGRWVRHWYPGKGDTLSLKIGYEAAPLLPCGAFEIDEIEFAQPPATVSIRGLATGIKKSVRTRVGRAYENTTLAAIAQRIAKRNKLTLTGKIRDIRIDRVTQYQERDVEFLTRLAREYGYAFKIVGSKLVFTELADLRDGKAVATLRATDLISIRLRDKIKDVYQQAKVKYHNPKTKKLVVYGVKNDGQVGEVGHTTAAAKKQSGSAASGEALPSSRPIQRQPVTMAHVGAGGFMRPVPRPVLIRAARPGTAVGRDAAAPPPAGPVRPDRRRAAAGHRRRGWRWHSRAPASATG